MNSAKDYPVDLLYSKDHQYLKKMKNGKYRIGITAFAQGQLGEISFVDFPTRGTYIKEEHAFGTVETQKATADLYMPSDGTIVALNTALNTSPHLVNTDPYGKGWIVEVELEDEPSDELMNAAEYRRFAKI